MYINKLGVGYITNKMVSNLILCILKDRYIDGVGFKKNSLFFKCRLLVYVCLD